MICDGWTYIDKAMLGGGAYFFGPFAQGFSSLASLIA
jgi:hypothetical protein